MKVRKQTISLAAPTLWNNLPLPPILDDPLSLLVFGKVAKMVLFGHVFGT